MKYFKQRNFLFLFFLGAISCEDKLDIVSYNSDIVNLQNAPPDSKGKKTYNLSRTNSSGEHISPLYDGSDSGPIDLSLAKDWIENFRNTIDAHDTRSHYFGRNVIDNILLQDNCTGLRIYYALKDNGEKVLIIAGVDSGGNIMLPLSQTVTIGENILADYSWPCPTVCNPPNGGW